MDTKTYLEQIARLDDMLMNTRLEIENLKQLAMSITVPMDKEKIQSSGISDIVGNNVTKYIDLERQKLGVWFGRRELVVSQIEQLSNRQFYRMLYARYVLDKRMSEIRVNESYSKSQANKILKAARDEFERKFGETYKNL